MRVLSRAAVLALALALVTLPAPSAIAATHPRASLPDIEDEVMCPVCGTLLELSESPQADRERAFIRRLIVEGRGKRQIKDALVREYGRSVLATPQASGFDLTAYLVPVLAFLAAAAAVAVGVWRWRRSAPSGREGGEQGAPRGEEAERLESDLARYDL
jgi:cytochrome c-type biogenesis protein CcmH